MKPATPLIGILGGMGPQAGLDMAHKLIMETRTEKDQDHLPFVLLSMPSSVPDRTEYLLGKITENPAYAIAEQFEVLAGMGANIAAMACNTAHAGPIFDVVLEILEARNVNIRLLHLVGETIDHLKLKYPGIHRVGVLATKGTYQSHLFDLALADAGLEAVNPNAETRDELIHAALYAPSIGIKSTGGAVTEEARRRVQLAIDHLRGRGAEAIILGCTELPLAVSGSSSDDLPILDPAVIMARKLISETYPEYLR
jgi:aspartate racemase